MLFFLFLFVQILLSNRVFRSQETVNIPTRYDKKNLATLDPTVVQYYSIPVCTSASAGLPFGKLTVNIPDNPTWNPNGQGLVYAEVSTLKTNWSAPIAVNYVYANFKVTPHPHSITFPYALSAFPDKTIYVRFKSNEIVQFSFEFGFTNTSINYKGQFNEVVFQQPTPPPGTTFAVARQYLRLSQAAVVNNLSAGLLLLFQFCPQDFPSQWGVKVNVIASVGHEDSAFDMYLCPTNKGLGYCNTQNPQIPAVNTDLSSVAFVSSQIDRAADALIEYGITVLVRGRGGTGQNYFTVIAQRV